MDAAVRRRIALIGVCAALALVGASCSSSGGSSTAQTPKATTPATHPATTPPSPSSSPKPGVWRLLPPAPVKTPMYSSAAVWDGKEVLLSGRVCPTKESVLGYTQTVAYDPATNTWRKLPPFPGPRGCFQGGDNAFWTGKELLLIGITNAAYDPATNTWRKLSPGGRGSFAEVTGWTRTQTLGFGGGCCGEAYDVVRSYTPGTNSWSDPPRSPLDGRNGVFGVWDGKELIVAGGGREETTGFTSFATGAAYDPVAKTWRSIAPLPASRQDSVAVWDGTKMLVVGGDRVGGDRVRYFSRGLSFDPSSNAWTPLPPMAYPRTGAAAVWTGSQMLVWGGVTTASRARVAPPHGEAFDPAAGTWTPLAESPLRGRNDPLAVWTGTQMFIWGGQATDGEVFYYNGAIYTPAT